MYESFEEKEYQKEEETSGKNWSKAQRLSLLATRSHVKNEVSDKTSVIVRTLHSLFSGFFLSSHFYDDSAYEGDEYGCCYEVYPLYRKNQNP